MAILQVYPAYPVPSYSYLVEEGYKTLISEFDSGAEQRRMLLRFSKRTFILNYLNNNQSDRDIVRSFFRKHKGASIPFWYFDCEKRKWTDEYLGQIKFEPLAGALAEDGGVFTDETSAANNSTPNDMTLLPAVPAINDAYYFGFEERFSCIRLFIETAGVGTWTITWEYWNGSAWATLIGVNDETSGFTVSGTKHISFPIYANWAEKTINTITAYWIRARVSSFTSITTQPKGTQCWRTQRYFALHSKNTIENSVKVYVNGVQITKETSWQFIQGGGSGESDRILLLYTPEEGYLLTTDFEGYLKIKGRFKDDLFREEIHSYQISNYSVSIQEVQW